jgi:hypothetical protein
VTIIDVTVMICGGQCINCILHGSEESGGGDSANE